MGKCFLGPLEMITSTESTCVYGALMTAQNTCYEGPLCSVSQRRSQSEGSELVASACTSMHQAPSIELGFGNYRCVFLYPPKMKEICQNGNLENYIYTCEIRQILIKLVSLLIQGSHNNALFCGRIFFFFSGCANTLRAGPYRLRENIHHYLLCQTQTEDQIGSMPGAGGHTYL